MSYIIRGPLPTVGPPAGAQDGTTPGCGYSTGTWMIVDGKLVNVPVPHDSTIWFPPGDGHPMPPTPGST
jgi:hypothetical protein